MRVAVVGSGVSGLSAAYLASAHAEVTLYESDTRLGGHADTHIVLFGEKRIAVDTGFMVFNPDRYPYFMQLLQELGINTVKTAMTFSVSIPGQIEYKSTVPSGMFFGQHVLNPRFYVFIYDILRFNYRAKRAIANIPVSESLGAFLDRHTFSKEFKEWYLFPMMGSIWSCSTQDLVDFSAIDTFRFLQGHKLLNVVFGSQWSTIPGGSKRYVDALEKKLIERKAKIVMGTPVVSVLRDASSISIVTASGTQTYDSVILATHADTALSIIDTPSDQERTILSAFGYTKNDMTLHGWPGIMPKRKSAWACWNYTTSADQKNSQISLTYDMNALQHIDATYPLFVTLNALTEIPNAFVHERFTYTHPRFSTKTSEAQQRLPEIQGKNRIYFAGSHWGYGFHEDGVASAVAAVKILGIDVPWK